MAQQRLDVPVDLLQYQLRTALTMEKQGESLIRRSDPSLLHVVVLSAALGIEHYEVSAYEALLVPVDAMGASEVAGLLRANLDQETHTAEELHKMLEKVTASNV